MIRPIIAYFWVALRWKDTCFISRVQQMMGTGFVELFLPSDTVPWVHLLCLSGSNSRTAVKSVSNWSHHIFPVCFQSLYCSFSPSSVQEPWVGLRARVVNELSGPLSLSRCTANLALFLPASLGPWPAVSTRRGGLWACDSPSPLLGSTGGLSTVDVKWTKMVPCQGSCTAYLVQRLERLLDG